MPVRIVFPRSLGEMKAQSRGTAVASALAEPLGRWIQPEVVSTYEELGRCVLHGEAEIAWMPPAPCAYVETEARAIFQVVREGGTRYRAAILARRDDELDLTHWTLQGRRAAWVDRLSTSGFLLPRLALRDEGLDPKTLFSEERMYGSYREAALAVAAGEADVCAVFVQSATEDAARQSLEQLLGRVGEHLAPIGYSPESPSDALVVTRACPDRPAEELIELLGAADVPAAVLEAFDALGFERVDPQLYSRMRGPASSRPPPGQ